VCHILSCRLVSTGTDVAWCRNRSSGIYRVEWCVLSLRPSVSVSLLPVGTSQGGKAGRERRGKKYEEDWKKEM
jgi:hypothetical protein